MKTAANYPTREQWLGAAAEEMRHEFFSDDFFSGDYPLPTKLAFTCGLIKGSNKAIGQCWAPEHSTDNTIHIYVCPRLDNPVEVLGVLLHELIHAAVGHQHGHKGPFVEAIRLVGLEGKPTATVVDKGSELEGRLEAIWARVGAYPHKAVVLKEKEKKKPSTLVRLDYEEDPNLNIYIARGKADEYGELLAELGFVIVDMETPKPSERKRVD